MWITLEQIACLKAVDDCGSVSSASDHLNKAKSAVHYSLKRLESQVGFPLLNTQTYRGELTPRAKHFLRRAEGLLRASQELEQDVRRIASGVESQLRLSATALFSIRKLNRNILKLQQSFPNTEIVLNREILSGERMLKKGLVDIAIFESPKDIKHLEVKKIARISMPLIIASQHPFLKLPKRQQVFERLSKYPQVIQKATLPTEESEGVYQTTNKWTVNDMDSKRQIIVDGLAWGRLPEHEIKEAVKQNSVTILRQIEKPTKLDVFLARRKMIEHGKVSQSLWEMSWNE